MLKAYHVHTYISVDHGPKVETERCGYGLTEDEVPRVVTTHYSFQDALNKELPTPAITTGKTFFRKRPYVEIQYSWYDESRYYNFDTLTIERHYEPWNITLKELTEEFSVEECAQYLKERGITTCPMNF